MEAEYDGLEDDFPFQMGVFSGSMLIFRGVVMSADEFVDLLRGGPAFFAWERIHITHPDGDDFPMGMVPAGYLLCFLRGYIVLPMAV